MKCTIMPSLFLICFLLTSLLPVNIKFFSALSGQEKRTTIDALAARVDRHVIANSESRRGLLAGSSVATLSIDPSQKSVEVGQTFIVNVQISSVEDLFAYEFKLTYNASVVNLTGPPRASIPQAGTFLVPSDGTSFFIAVWTLNETSSYLPPNQTAHVAYSLLTPETGRSGSGILVTFTIKALTAGSTTLDLNNDMLVDATGNLIPHDSVNGLVTVSRPPTVTISPVSMIMDVGQFLQFNSTVLGGIPPFAYQWCLDNASIYGSTNPTWTFFPVAAGSYSVYLNVTDSVGAKAKSNITLVTVNPALLVTILPSSATIDLDQSMMLNSSISGGTFPFNYQWYLDDVSISGANDPTWTSIPDSIGIHQVYVNVTDGAGLVAKSNTATLTINPTVSVGISPTSIVMNVSQPQLFTALVTNGTPPYVYRWYLNSTLVSGAASSTWVFTPTITGTYYVMVEVVDSVNIACQSEDARIIVLPNPSSVHDIALEAISNSKSGCKPIPTIGENGTLRIEVRVHNLGDSSETFEVIVYANATEIQRMAVIDLAPGATLDLTCDWSTVGFVRGNYVISAYAEPVEGETNMANNRITGETVAIVIQGDINADGRVNILDMVRIAIKVGMTYPNVNWDPNADLNSDGKINILDIVVVAIHFGEAV